MALRTKFIAIILTLLCVSLAQASNSFCPNQSIEANRVASTKIDPVLKSSHNENRFFIGLYSKLESKDRAQIAHALRRTKPEELTARLTAAQNELASHLKKDKEFFKLWLDQNGLNDQVKILPVPENNYFLLFDATKNAAVRITCAAASGQLPQAFLDLGRGF